MILLMIFVSSCSMAGLVGFGMCLAVGTLVTGGRKRVGLLDASCLVLVSSAAIGRLTSTGEDCWLALAIGSTAELTWGIL